MARRNHAEVLPVNLRDGQSWRLQPPDDELRRLTRALTCLGLLLWVTVVAGFALRWVAPPLAVQIDVVPAPEIDLRTPADDADAQGGAVPPGEWRPAREEAEPPLEDVSRGIEGDSQ